MQLALEIRDLCAQYNATIRACKDLIVIDVDGDRRVLQLRGVCNRIGKPGTKQLEWENYVPREVRRCLS